jgi:hypothetical protein
VWVIRGRGGLGGGDGSGVGGGGWPMNAPLPVRSLEWTGRAGLSCAAGGFSRDTKRLTLVFLKHKPALMAAQPISELSWKQRERAGRQTQVQGQ